MRWRGAPNAMLVKLLPLRTLPVHELLLVISCITACVLLVLATLLGLLGLQAIPRCRSIRANQGHNFLAAQLQGT